MEELVEYKRNYKPLRTGAEFITKTYKNQEFKCAIVKDYEGWKWLVIPESLTAIAEGDDDEGREYPEDLWKLAHPYALINAPDKILECKEKLMQFLANENPYEFAENWDGTFTIINASELECLKK